MKTNGRRLGVAVLSGFLVVVLIRGLTGCSSGDTADAEPPVPGATDEAAVVTDETAEQLPPGIVDLGNTVCPVMGGSVMEGEYVDWEGYRVHFCCSGCDETFLSDPEHYLGVLAEEPSVAGILESGCPHCAPDECTCEEPPLDEITGESCPHCAPDPCSCGG